MFGLAKRKPERIATAPGECIYAVGDVHGRLDLLVSLLDRIEADTVSVAEGDAVRVIFLGDLIDRGPDSMACMQIVQGLVESGGAELLLGNHEDLLLRAVAGEAAAQAIWMEHGGRATLLELGVEPIGDVEDPFDFGERIAKVLPDTLAPFLSALPKSADSGDYFFCHAGVRPRIGLDKQDETDLYLIRDAFTGSQRWHGKMVVHGHSISEGVDIQPNRIGVDTGAYRTDVLSSVRLYGERVDVLQASV